MNILIKALASGLGTGYLPVSGTWGSGLALAIAWFFFPEDPWLISAITLFALIISVPVAGAAEKRYGQKDDSRIVIDEIAGYWVSILFLPRSLKPMLAAFVLFRVFDVIKPFFIRRTQAWPGGWGIVADDFFAGLLTNLLMQMLLFWSWNWF